MYGIDSLEDYLYTVLENYLNADLDRINTLNGRNLDKIYPCFFEKKEVNQGELQNFCLKVAKEVMEKNGMDITDNNVALTMSKMKYGINSYTFNSTLGNNTSPMGDVTNEYTLNVNGDNYIKVLDILYNAFKNASIPYEIITNNIALQNEPYKICIVCNDAYREQTEEIIKGLELDDLLIKYSTFGPKITETVSYSRYSDTGLNINVSAKMKFMKGVNDIVDRWIENNRKSDDPNDANLIEYVNRSSSRDLINKYVIKHVEMDDPSIRDEIVEQIMVYLRESGIDYESAFLISKQNETLEPTVLEDVQSDGTFNPNEFERTIELDAVKIVHEEELTTNVTDEVPTDEVSYVEEMDEASLTSEDSVKQVPETNIFDEQTEISRGVASFEEPIENIVNGLRTASTNVEEVSPDQILPVEQLLDENERTAIIEASVEQEQDLTDTRNEIIAKYNGIIKETDFSLPVLGGTTNLVDYLESNNVLGLIDINESITMDDGTIMTGYDFIVNRVIPCVIQFNHQSVQETIDKYASQYFANKNKKNSKLLGIFSRK